MGESKKTFDTDSLMMSYQDSLKRIEAAYAKGNISEAKYKHELAMLNMYNDIGEVENYEFDETISTLENSNEANISSEFRLAPELPPAAPPQKATGYESDYVIDLENNNEVGANGSSLSLEDMVEDLKLELEYLNKKIEKKNKVNYLAIAAAVLAVLLSLLIPGPQGEMGPRGFQGEQGVPGVPGMDGLPGRDGKTPKSICNYQTVVTDVDLSYSYFNNSYRLYPRTTRLYICNFY